MPECKHLGPSASDEAKKKCKLCTDLAVHGKPVSKTAIRLLNTMPTQQSSGKECPRCSKIVPYLVSREDEHICEPCAEELDDA